MSGIVDAIFGGGDSGANTQNMDSMAAANAEIGKMQQETAREYLDFQKQQYADLKPLAEKLSAAQIGYMEEQSALAKTNAARADEYAAFEKDTFRPLEKSLVEEASSYDTDAKREELARKGIADVATAYEAQKKQALATLSSYGINPNSNRFAAINAQLAQGEAADKAGAATNARSQAEQLGYARKLDAASLGRNLASNASTAYGVSLNASNSASATGTSALNTAGNPGQNMGSSYGSYNAQLGNAGNSYGTAGNIYGTAYKAQMSADAASSAGMGQLMGQIGSAAITKGYADGGDVHEGAGRVRGVGGPVDDKIDAKLSNGEYVLPADTVKAIGVKKLDKIVKKTHTPAAIQRRQAISARG
jgi:hypothetical protein